MKHITFRAILEKYRAQPQASSKVGLLIYIILSSCFCSLCFNFVVKHFTQIFREVLLESPGTYGDIIAYYNRVILYPDERSTCRLVINRGI